MTTTHPSANDSGLNLDHLEALAKAAQISILRMGMNGRPNDYFALMNAMPPEAVLALIALARRAALANQPAPTVPATDSDLRTVAQFLMDRYDEMRAKGAPSAVEFDLLRAALDAHQPAQEQAKPLDTPLPCDITVGAVTIRKGVKLRTLVTRMESLHGMAMKAFPEPTPEARAMIDSMIAGTWDGAAQQEPVAAPKESFNGDGNA